METDANGARRNDRRKTGSLNRYDNMNSQTDLWFAANPQRAERNRRQSQSGFLPVYDPETSRHLFEFTADVEERLTAIMKKLIRRKRCAVELKAGWREWIVRSGCLLAVLAVSGLAAATLRGETVTVPPGLGNVEGGGGFAYPFDTFSSNVEYTRVQQLYSASVLPAISPGIRITELAFRADGSPGRIGRSFDAVIPGVEIRMSTTSRTPASFNGNFSANAGANETVVFPQAPVRWATTWVQGVNPFNLRIPLATPFDYNPADGNLLIDITVTGKARTDGLDFHGFSGAVAWAIEPGNTDQFLRDRGIVAQLSFQAIPEPSTCMLLVAALFALGLRMPLKRR